MEKKPGSGRTRRQFLYGVGAIGAVKILEQMAPRIEANSQDDAAEVLPQHHAEIVVPSIETAQPETFDVPSALQGRKLANLYADYLGYKGHLPSEISINAPLVLATLWDDKFEFAGTSIEPGVKGLAEERLQAYLSRWMMAPGTKRDEALGRTDLKTLSGELTDTAERLTQALATEQAAGLLASRYALNESERSTFLYLMSRIDGPTLLAYSMTELLPSDDGDYNADFYDFELATLGKEGIATKPAKYDKYASFGPYQFTRFAINDDGDPTADGSLEPEMAGMIFPDGVAPQRRNLHGASILNQALPDGLRIPNDVTDLYTFEEHARAAYLFAANNIASSVNGLPLRMLESLRHLDSETLGQFIAVSHTRPSDAHTALRKYLGSREVATHNSRIALYESSFQKCCGEQLGIYAQKTRANYRGINKHLGTTQANAAGERRRG